MNEAAVLLYWRSALVLLIANCELRLVISPLHFTSYNIQISKEKYFVHLSKAHFRRNVECVMYI